MGVPVRETDSTVSPVVEAWATYRTSTADDWPARRLVRAKGASRVSVVLPARNEEATVGAIVSTVREHLMDRVPLVDERGALSGIVALDDVIGVLASLLNSLAGSIKNQQFREWSARRG